MLLLFFVCASFVIRHTNPESFFSFFSVWFELNGWRGGDAPTCNAMDNTNAVHHSTETRPCLALRTCAVRLSSWKLSGGQPVWVYSTAPHLTLLKKGEVGARVACFLGTGVIKEIRPADGVHVVKIRQVCVRARPACLPACARACVPACLSVCVHARACETLASIASSFFIFLLSSYFPFGACVRACAFSSARARRTCSPAPSPSSRPQPETR